jgi:uncharacterized membrane protein
LPLSNNEDIPMSQSAPASQHSAPQLPVLQHSATAEVIIDLPREQVWERLRDLSKAHYYVPRLTNTTINTQQKEGVGTSRTVFAKGMAPMDETVVEWTEGYGFKIRLHRGERAAAPFKDAIFVYAIEDAGPGKTAFKPAIHYTLPGGAIVNAIGNLLLGGVMRGNVEQVAQKLKQYYETGEPSNPLFDVAKG